MKNMDGILAIMFLIAGLCSSGSTSIGLFIVSGLFEIAAAINNHK